MKKEFIEHYTETVWNLKDLKIIEEAFAEEAKVHTLFGPLKGPKGMKDCVEIWLQGFPDLQVKNIHMIEDGETIAAHFEAKGTHLGEFKGLSPTDKQVFYQGMSVFKFEKDKIVEYRGFIDMLHLLNQLK